MSDGKASFAATKLRDEEWRIFNDPFAVCDIFTEIHFEEFLTQDSSSDFFGPECATKSGLAWDFHVFQSKIRDGIVLIEETNPDSGKLVTRLSELPLNRAFFTPLGNKLTRVSDTEVVFADGRRVTIAHHELIGTQDGTVPTTPEEKPDMPNNSKDTPPTQSRRSRPRSASQSGDRQPSTKLSVSTPKSPDKSPSSSSTQAVDGLNSSPAQSTRLGALDLSTGARSMIETIKSAISPHTSKEKLFGHRPPQLLPGEKEIFVCHEVEYVVSEKVSHPGSIFLTNYQVLFRSSDAKQSVREVSLAPLGKVTRIEKVGGKKSSLISSALTRQLVIHCKDFHKDIVIRMASSNAGQRKQLFDLINKRAFHGEISKLFAFSYNPPWKFPIKPVTVSGLQQTLRSDANIGINGWNLFNFDVEFKRLGVFDRHVDGTPAWRYTFVNNSYVLCKSYPECLVVPNQISDAQLLKVSQFRTQSRIPILSWVHKNGASITRCSQPKSGLVTSRSPEDELLLSLIRQTSEAQQFPLVIIDPRPRSNAEANRAVGAGYEKESNYAKAKVHFMGIDNIHVVRDSQQALATLCATISSKNDSIWLSSVEGTGWLRHIKSILVASTLITKCIHQHGASCLVHCSDGWDRTSQVVSLAMLCMDPFYRSISGFCTLIEKEWVRAGHMFSTRHGHASKNYSDDMRAPIFLQWMDCIWQLCRQFPTSFEFNENFLIRIVDEVCNCRFGTFLMDNEAAMKEHHVESTTVSLWTYIHHKDNFYRFVNPVYSPPLSSSSLASKSAAVLIPKTSLFALGFWANCYLQGSNFRDRTIECAMERAFELHCKIEDLELRIAELERENSMLKGDIARPLPATTSAASISDVTTKTSSHPNNTNEPPVSKQRDSGDVLLDRLVYDLTLVGNNKVQFSIPSIISSSVPDSQPLITPRIAHRDSTGLKSSSGEDSGPEPEALEHVDEDFDDEEQTQPFRSKPKTILHSANETIPSDDEDHNIDWNDSELDQPRVTLPAKLGTNIIEDYGAKPKTPNTS